MHAVLAEPCDDPAFAPEVADDAEVAACTRAARAQVEAALEVLGGRSEWSAPDWAARATALCEKREALLGRMGELAARGSGAARTRIHGDLHLGQVLVTGGDVTIIDFEGEPGKPLETRRAKTSPLRDVAGVLRSFSYAAAMVERSHPPEPKAAEARADSLFETFRRLAADAFLEGYEDAGGRVDRALLDLFLLEKAAYEVCYEAANRPTWLEVPLRGLAAIATRVLSKRGAAR
jgi:maltose alpha-D-glucosyltransferase/alpha-amylase